MATRWACNSQATESSGRGRLGLRFQPWETNLLAYMRTLPHGTNEGMPDTYAPEHPPVEGKSAQHHGELDVGSHMCVIERSLVRASEYVVKCGRKLPNPVKKLLMIVEKHNQNAGST